MAPTIRLGRPTTRADGLIGVIRKLFPDIGSPRTLNGLRAIDEISPLCAATNPQSERTSYD